MNTEPLILDWSLAAAEIRAEEEAMDRELRNERMAMEADRYEQVRELNAQLAQQQAFEDELRDGVTKVDKYGRTLYTSLPADVQQWLRENDISSQFARSLTDQFSAKGFLTEGQVNGVRKCIARAAQPRATESEVSQAEELKASLERAKASGLKYPRLRFAGFAFTLAGERSKNPGAVYVKSAHGEYLGKVVGNRFSAGYGVSAEIREQAEQVLRDPKSAAVAYGKEYGICSCCGRDLTDPVSVERGIGPICADRYGF